MNTHSSGPIWSMIKGLSARTGRLGLVALAMLGAAPIGGLAFAEPAASESVARPGQSLESMLGPLVDERVAGSTRVGLQVVNVRTGEEVFSRNPDAMLLPASTMKMLTAATALRALGPTYRFTTEILTDRDAQVDAEGVLAGTLYVRGHGDPSLVVEDLWRLVHDLKNQGVTRVKGDIVFDDSFHENAHQIPGWNKTSDIDNGPSYFPSIGALSANYNTATILVKPGSEVGRPARAFLDTPAGEYVQIESSLMTSSPGSRRSVKVERRVAEENGASRVVFSVSGTVPADAGVHRYYRTIPDPTAHFMGVFRELFAQQGLQHEGLTRQGAAPQNAVLLAQKRSAELTTILMDMNKQSNNFMAEQVLRTIGAEVYGLPGTTQNGLRVVADYLNGLGFGADDYQLVNGSGLSRDLKLRPSVLTAVLLDMVHDRRVGAEFYTSLAIAGRDGTLWRRLTDDPGRLRGKTGSLDGVHCLAGYLEGADGELYAFSFMVNDIRGDSAQVKRFYDRLARRMFMTVPTGPEVVESEGEGTED